MNQKKLSINGKNGEGYMIPCGPIKVVFVSTESGGFIGCGAFDIQALEKFNCAAVKVRGVANVDELLAKPVVEVNAAAAAKGVTVGMTGREAFGRL